MRAPRRRPSATSDDAATPAPPARAHATSLALALVVMSAAWACPPLLTDASGRPGQLAH
jgi:hypothetical protein